jgi:DNA mismatch endonuclease (patch repair protein)
MNAISGQHAACALVISNNVDRLTYLARKNEPPLRRLEMGCPMVPPRPLSPSISSRMARQRTRRTKPEVLLTRELRLLGIRYRTNAVGLPGTPDLVLTDHRVAIFVHGCFWHGCPAHFTLPRHNRAWWKEKIEGNRRRDRRKVSQLRRLGWSVITAWEHDDPGRIAKRVQRKVEELR